MLMDILKKKMKDLEKRTKTTVAIFSPRKSALIAEKEFNYENFGKVRIVLFR
jgi:hypothetical protein